MLILWTVRTCRLLYAKPIDLAKIFQTDMVIREETSVKNKVAFVAIWAEDRPFRRRESIRPRRWRFADRDHGGNG